MLQQFNKICIAAMLAATSVAASAQSSVTIFGTVDAGLTRLTGSKGSVTGVSTSNANISRIGFRGIEDMGGGLKAQFWLEAGYDVDTGNGKTGGALSFNRRSTISLMNDYGELRMGRDDSATFLNTLIFDPFLTNGVGGTMSFIMLGAPIQLARTISYFTPDLNGFYAQAQYATADTAPAAAGRQGRYLGARGGYRKGPLHVAGATGELQNANPALDVRATNLAASYDFGFVRPAVIWATERNGTTKITALQLGVTVPIGVTDIRAQVSHYDTANSNADWNKYAIGLGYNLSKRTMLYGTVAHISNKAGASKSVGAMGLTAPGTALGSSSSGYEVGIRHFF